LNLVFYFTSTCSFTSRRVTLYVKAILRQGWSYLRYSSKAAKLCLRKCYNSVEPFAALYQIYRPGIWTQDLLC